MGASASVAARALYARRTILSECQYPTKFTTAAIPRATRSPIFPPSRSPITRMTPFIAASRIVVFIAFFTSLVLQIAIGAAYLGQESTCRSPGLQSRSKPHAG
jgi:hypothetical protein